jgi:hypothetical protein
LLLSQFAFSQENDGYSINQPKFYKQKLHFGFTIAFNQTDFRINPVENSLFPDTVIRSNNIETRYRIKSVYTRPGPGFAIGLVTDFRIFEYLRLRTTPSISFASRKIEYFLSNATRDTSKYFEKTVESTFLIFPLEAKVQSKRLGNFSAYVIGGGGYMLDLASRKKAAGVSSGGANQLDDNVKLKRDDFYYSGGAGVDFYLMYFKLGFELKLHTGTRNLLRTENSIFTNSIQKVRSRMVTFTVTFEG